MSARSANSEESSMNMWSWNSFHDVFQEKANFQTLTLFFLFFHILACSVARETINFRKSSTTECSVPKWICRGSEGGRSLTKTGRSFLPSWAGADRFPQTRCCFPPQERFQSASASSSASSSVRFPQSLDEPLGFFQLLFPQTRIVLVRHVLFPESSAFFRLPHSLTLLSPQPRLSISSSCSSPISRLPQSRCWLDQARFSTSSVSSSSSPKFLFPHTRILLSPHARLSSSNSSSARLPHTRILLSPQPRLSGSSSKTSLSPRFPHTRSWFLPQALFSSSDIDSSRLPSLLPHTLILLSPHPLFPQTLILLSPQPRLLASSSSLLPHTLILLSPHPLLSSVSSSSVIPDTSRFCHALIVLFSACAFVSLTSASSPFVHVSITIRNIAAAQIRHGALPILLSPSDLPLTTLNLHERQIVEGLIQRMLHNLRYLSQAASL